MLYNSINTNEEHFILLQHIPGECWVLGDVNTLSMVELAQKISRTCPEAPVGAAVCHVEVDRAAAIAVPQDGLEGGNQIIRAGVGHLLPKVRDPPSAACE